jgi:nucleoside-triphosphatase
MNIFVTGKPGIGKTSVVQKTIMSLRALGYIAGGVYCPEIRVNHTRVGFEIVNLKTGNRGVLAHIDQKKGPRVGRYRVNIENLKQVGVEAIKNGLETADYVVIDEVGPMELASGEFRKIIFSAFESSKPVLCIIHYRLQHSIINNIETRKKTRIYEVTLKNRIKLHEKIANELNNEMKKDKH